jgi:hypothetical protein
VAGRLKRLEANGSAQYKHAEADFTIMPLVDSITDKLYG